MTILVINPGSTSTKVAIYNDENQIWVTTIHHTPEELAAFHDVNEQFDYRTEMVRRAVAEAGFAMNFDCIVARGGLLRPTPGGVYEVDELMKHDLIHAQQKHVCNLGGLIADKLAVEIGCPAFIADPEVVDELMPAARLTGIPEINRISIFHALNSKAVSRVYAKSIGRRYEQLNLIVAHLGGGISVSAHRHGKVVDTNNALNGDGPFSPERAGTVPADQLAELCFSGKYTLAEIKRMLNGRGGLAAHLGTQDVRMVVEKACAGEEPYRHVLDAMIYTVAKEIGARSVIFRGHIDAIIFTGGIAHSEYVVDKLKEWVGFLAPIVLMPGEDEMRSLAMNALRALRGEQEIIRYNPDGYIQDCEIREAQRLAEPIRR